MKKELEEHGIELRERMYSFIVKYISENGYAPTVREIGQAVDVAVSRVKHHLMKLEIEGRIKVKDKSPRAIKVIGYEFRKVEG